MKLTGLITEYNPFHNGHLHHLTESIRLTDCSHTVAVMSGHFLQRGEIALCDKWSRAAAAVSSGVDLVVELPSIYACASAEHFAKGSVMALDALCCQNVCFGSEAGDLAPLMATAVALSDESLAFKEALKGHLKKGLSYPAARQLSLIAEMGLETDFTSNNILGVEYLKALIRTESTMMPYTIKRLSAAYDEKQLTGHISSATAIRNSLTAPGFTWDLIQSTLPPATFSMLKTLSDSSELTVQELAFPFIRYQILSEETDDLADFHEISDDIAPRIRAAALKAVSLDNLIDRIKTKAYTRTRIQRGLMNLLLKRKKEHLLPLLESAEMPYLRVLAYNNKGRDIIRHVKKHSETPLMTNPSRFKSWTPERHHFFTEDVKSTNLFRLIQGSDLVGEDYLRKPVELG